MKKNNPAWIYVCCSQQQNSCQPAQTVGCRLHPQPVLSCKAVFVMLVSKGGKSLQLSLNELIPKLGPPDHTVSRVAYAKARQKLKYTFSMALNQETVVRTMYEDGDYQTLKPRRYSVASPTPTNGPTRMVSMPMLMHPSSTMY